VPVFIDGAERGSRRSPSRCRRARVVELVNGTERRKVPVTMKAARISRHRAAEVAAGAAICRSARPRGPP
jgi:hypothetical protein